MNISFIVLKTGKEIIIHSDNVPEAIYAFNLKCPFKLTIKTNIQYLENVFKIVYISWPGVKWSIRCSQILKCWVMLYFQYV